MVTGLLSVPGSVFGSPLIWLRASNDTPTDWSADRSEGSPPSGTLRCRDLTFGRPRGIPPRSDIRFSTARLRDDGPILVHGVEAMVQLGSPSPRIEIGAPLKSSRSGPRNYHFISILHPGRFRPPDARRHLEGSPRLLLSCAKA